MTYENQAQVEAHESPRGRRLPWQLRCATKRDDGQMASATDERHHEFWRPSSRCCSVYRSLR